ncbi:hypothetical protein [Enterovirga aerilata]|uniref:Uncharacterized protein n=1 Tax=Enterovirga aerilata TaxID=2730920 RepID=A0A849HZ47_9HYPH|nr:hypothetical protein [Enterovirga sp. DB1703]NNM72372.1 hypothetical protein [Enterovirga sp. DB1703]
MATTTMNSSVLGSAAAGGRSFGTIRTFLEIAGAAIRCASAVEAGRRPNSRDLKTLGIGEALPHTQLFGR